MPKYGTLRLGTRSWGFVLDEPEGKTARLFVDTNGDVVGVIFAIAPQGALDHDRAAYVLDRSEIAGFMAEVAAFDERSVVNTGKCLK